MTKSGRKWSERVVGSDAFAVNLQLKTRPMDVARLLGWRMTPMVYVAKAWVVAMRSE